MTSNYFFNTLLFTTVGFLSLLSTLTIEGKFYSMIIIMESSVCFVIGLYFVMKEYNKEYMLKKESSDQHNL